VSQANNVFQLVAVIAEREVIRYTPAGIPIASAILQHRSEPIEAGIKRLIEFEISALAVGEISGRFSQAALGGSFWFTGFMARKSRNGRSLVFHITDFAAIEIADELISQNLDTGAKNGIR
jgi:primosomal replication protein N